MKILLLGLFLFITSRALASNNKCKTSYDNLGIPHVEVTSTEDFYFCFGFHHGRDRAWQMDYFRRVAEGRNAEVLGFSQLKSDLMMRLLDLPSAAKKIWDSFNPSQKETFLHYTSGVNEGFKEGKKAQEFKDLDYSPEEWEPENTIVLLLLQSFDQTKKSFLSDYLEEKNKEEWGDKAKELFDEEGMPWENNILKEGEYQKRVTSRSSSSPSNQVVKIWANFPEVFGKESGSNNWVISGKKSKTGKAILANDPHLDLKTPLFWYWLHLKSPELEVIGASLPGVPVVVSGTNGQVAWGLTNAYLNAADVVFLNNPPAESIKSIRPVVWVKFWFLKIPFFFKSFEKLISNHPILPLETETDKKLALRWTGFDLKSDEVLPMLKLVEAKNVEDMNSILKEVGIPAWNFVFADTKGDIGFRVVGKTYRHFSKTPYGIPSESIEEFKQVDSLSPEERPYVIKPERNYIYTANNRHWPMDAAFYGGRAYSFSFRGLRIDELLQGQHDPESFKAMQCDHQVVDARFFLPLIFNHIESPLLANWKMVATDGSIELSVYRRLMDIMMSGWKVNEYALYRLLKERTPTRKKEVQNFYELAVKDVNGRSWKDFHRLNFDHLSKNDDWNFSPEMSGVGDNHTVDPGTSRWNSSKNIFEQYSGASMRMIIEMRERPHIQLVLPGFNREYTNEKTNSPWQDWKECKYTEVSF